MFQTLFQYLSIRARDRVASVSSDPMARTLDSAALLGVHVPVVMNEYEAVFKTIREINLCKGQVFSAGCIP
jgi:hypothetical protein